MLLFFSCGLQEAAVDLGNIMSQATSPVKATPTPASKKNAATKTSRSTKPKPGAEDELSAHKPRQLFRTPPTTKGKDKDRKNDNDDDDDDDGDQDMSASEDEERSQKASEASEDEGPEQIPEDNEDKDVFKGRFGLKKAKLSEEQEPQEEHGSQTTALVLQSTDPVPAVYESSFQSLPVALRTKLQSLSAELVNAMPVGGSSFFDCTHLLHHHVLSNY